MSVLLADRKNCPHPESHKIAATYQNKGTLKTMANITRHRGPFGLYTGFKLHLCTSRWVGESRLVGVQGLTVNIVRDALGTGIYFMTYESSKQLLTNFGGAGAPSNPLAVLVAGGLCGIVSWAMICE